MRNGAIIEENYRMLSSPAGEGIFILRCSGEELIYYISKFKLPHAPLLCERRIEDKIEFSCSFWLGEKICGEKICGLLVEIYRMEKLAASAAILLLFESSLKILENIGYLPPYGPLTIWYTFAEGILFLGTRSTKKAQGFIEIRNRVIAEDNNRMLSSPASEGIYQFKMLGCANIENISKNVEAGLGVRRMIYQQAYKETEGHSKHFMQRDLLLSLNRYEVHLDRCYSSKSSTVAASFVATTYVRFSFVAPYPSKLSFIFDLLLLFSYEKGQRKIWECLAVQVLAIRKCLLDLSR
ncbi:hypothetical protein TIFTF001_014459 [Ficus carica]|uniref:Uncharacterized protein n=1 Tax=Ficus carica TaxID=3494 RepID=A0AA88AG31_FICCA|nr:hypothetical protein TIFTF001_014459 [Ficus carica]